MTMERRALVAAPELRAGDKGKTIAGYAALFNSAADIGGMFREVIAPGAFAETLKGDIRALVDHDSGRVIGRTTSGTLRLSEDDKGLAIEVDLPDTSDGRDLAVSLERGDISGMSFGFRVTHDEWDETTSPPTRTVHKVDLFEVSAVAFPAYADTELALRSLKDDQGKRELAEKNAAAAKARIAARRAQTEQKIRGIK